MISLVEIEPSNEQHEPDHPASGTHPQFGEPEAIHTISTLPPPPSPATQPDLGDMPHQDIVEAGYAGVALSQAHDDLLTALLAVPMNRSRRDEVCRCLARVESLGVAFARILDEMHELEDDDQ